MDVSKRAFNFCAGPAALPDAVLQRAQAEMLDWRGKGLSVMEMSHRSDDYVAIAEKAEQDLRDLLSVPSNYKVLFLQGGASQQFAEIPLNLLPENGTADYVETGIWSKKPSKRPAVSVASTWLPAPSPTTTWPSWPERVEADQECCLRSLRVQRNHRRPAVRLGAGNW